MAKVDLNGSLYGGVPAPITNGSSAAPQRVETHSDAEHDHDGDDQASISATSADTLKAQLNNVPDVRQQRVQALQQQVQGGAYQVNASDVATAMLGEHVA